MSAVVTEKRVLVKLPALRTEIEIAQQWLQSRDELVGAASAITSVNDAKSFEAASWVMAKTTKLSNDLEAHRKALSKPFRDASDTIKQAADAALEPVLSEKSRLQKMLAEYAEAERRKQAEEAKRIEAEQRRQIEEQLAKKQAEEDLLGESTETFTPVISTPAPVVQAPKAAGVRTVQRLVWDVEREDEVPRGMMTVDASRVNAYQREHAEYVRQMVADGKGGEVIKGIVFRIETSVVAR